MAADEPPPSRVSAEELLDLVEKVVYHPNSSEKELSKRLIDPSKAGDARRASQRLNLLSEEDGQLIPSDTARELAFADGEERRRVLLEEVILNYDLYEVPLERFVETTDDGEPLLADQLQKYWGAQVGLELSKDALLRASTTLLKLLDFCGVGDYIMGRRGNPTRLEPTAEGFDLLQNKVAERRQARREAARETRGTTDTEEGLGEETGNRQAGTEGRGGRMESSTSAPQDIRSGQSSDYEVHETSDKSAIIWIQPSERSIQFLEELTGFLRAVHMTGDEPRQAKEEDTDVEEVHTVREGDAKTSRESTNPRHQPQHDMVSGGDSEDE